MITAIICAAGKGARAGFSENKILKEYNGMPVLCYSLSAFASNEEIDEIVVACREEDEKQILALLRPYQSARTVRGGATRMESVFSALQAAKGDLVLVHDAARPFLSQKVISDCIASVKKYGSGVCALPATDTAVLAKDGEAVGYLERESVFTVQTPQGYNREELLSAYECAFREKKSFTDESGIYGAYLKPPRLFLGERTNRKLTYPEDFQPAERVGFGVDTHAFDIPEDYALGIMRLNMNYIRLCGVTIPSQFSLKAHSDGDVAVHALMDALLSAKGLRDIGYYFPDTDEKYKGADSMDLLREVLKKTGKPKNVSISVLAEAPRLSPYIEKMQETLSKALGIPLSAVAVAAGTNEKLGYIGEGKGITVYATVLL